VRHIFELDGVVHTLWLARHDGAWRVSGEAGCAIVALDGDDATDRRLRLDGETHAVAAIADGDVVHVQIDGRAYALRYRDPVDFHAADSDAGGHDVARAPMPGIVLAVHVAVGAHVRAGEVLLRIESMKLETAILAGRDGTVETVHVTPGQTFDRDAALVTLLRDEA
jgi:biotin carboxyl carrier protein